MRIGLIARADNSGLGMLSWEFYNHFREYFTKVLIINNGAYQPFPERFDQANYFSVGDLNSNRIEKFLKDLDILLAIETPYNWFFFSLAKYMKVKTVLIPMFECNDKPLESYPDLIACPSRLDYKSFENESSKLEIIPLPINRARVRYRKRKKALIFKHHVGHGGLADRTGINDLLKTIPLVKSRVSFIINSQIDIGKVYDTRVEVRKGNIRNYWDLWNEGDVFLFPTNQEMISMPLNEALASGMPVLTTEFDFFKEQLPTDWLIKPKEIRSIKLHKRSLNYAFLDPKMISDKIDEWAGRDIAEDSEMANEIAEKMSWEKLRPRWLELFESL